jgi:hypothetical protein
VDYRGQRLFNTFDIDESPELLRKRRPGHYEALIPLPGEILKAGRYAIGLDSGVTSSPKRPDHQRFDDLFEFEVRETFSNSLKAYAPHRTGMIALRLNWETRPLAEVMPGPVQGLTCCRHRN